MPHLRRALAVVLAAVALTWVAAGTAGAQTSPAAAPDQLYVLQVGSGSLERVGKEWHLTLRDPYRTVTSFTDRPARVGGSVHLQRFVAAWPRTFAGDPPNAALQIDDAPPGRDVVLLELGRPRLDRTGHALTLRVTPLRTTRQTTLRALALRADARINPRFGRASLFVDDSASPTGFPLTITVAGTQPGPARFLFSPANSSFQPGGTLESGFPFGLTVIPSMTVNSSAQFLTIDLPGGAGVTAQVLVDSTPAGAPLQGIVTLPAGYVATFQTSAGKVDADQSGPVTIPVPR
jgi:hypothetical protein